MTCEYSKSPCIDHARADLRRVARRESFSLLCDRGPNPARPDNRNGYGRARAVLGSGLGLEDRLGEERDEAVAAALGEALHFDEILSPAGISKDVCLNISHGSLSTNLPTSFAEQIPHDAL
ncbi:MAG: hypothetical protein OXH83_06485 [Bryobacterales bacterium]|nr:hypothetical protein [Bryobacterales bacterium]